MFLFIIMGIRAGIAMLKEVVLEIVLCVNRLASLPWHEYYNQTASVIEIFVSGLLLMEAAFEKAGYAWVGRLVAVFFYLGALACLYMTAVTLWWLFRAILTICWIVLYPVRFAFGLLYRPRIGHNQNGPAAPPLSPAPIVPTAPHRLAPAPIVPTAPLPAWYGHIDVTEDDEDDEDDGDDGDDGDDEDDEDDSDNTMVGDK